MRVDSKVARLVDKTAVTKVGTMVGMMAVRMAGWKDVEKAYELVDSWASRSVDSKVASWVDKTAVTKVGTRVGMMAARMA